MSLLREPARSRAPLASARREGGELELAWSRHIGGVEPMTWARPSLVCPRGASRGVVVGRDRVSADSRSVVWVPAGLTVSVEASSVLWDAMTLFPSTRYVAELLSENPLDASDGDRLRTDLFSVKRSRWLDDIVERYFYERVVNPDAPLGCTSFLEKQILNEFVRLAFPSRFKTRHGEVLDAPTDPATVALDYLEAHVFEEISLDTLAQKTGTTKNALVASFRDAFGIPPYAYVKRRRLDEAMRMLQSGDYQVADVGRIVGYRDLSSFSKAMRAQFGSAPSDFLPKGPVRARGTADMGAKQSGAEGSPSREG